MRRRNEDQEAFDLIKHGYAFTNVKGLTERVMACEVIAERLAPDDPRHTEMKVMKGMLQRATEISAVKTKPKSDDD